MAQHLSSSITGCSSTLSVTVTDSYSAPTASATITCLNSSLDVGDAVSISLGYGGSNNRVFAGYVKNVQRSQSPTQYEITCANAMVRAVDFFIVSDSPLTPYSREHIKAETLVGQLMAMAGLTNYSGSNTSFTFATNGTPLEVNLTSVYDFCKMVADLLAWHVYADDDGKVWFKSRPPFPDGDSSVATYGDADILDVSFWRSDRDLRNRVVVYGSEGITAEAQASSPYLPSGFHKSVLVAAPTLITNQGMANLTASYNLAKLNRLTIGGSLTTFGDSTLRCRDCITVNKSDIDMTGQFFIYGIEHQWSKDGYRTTMDLRQ
jgi:hypothetical protein